MKKAKKSSRSAPAKRHHPHMRRAEHAADEAAPMIEVRRSSIHGRGVYATRPIRKGMRIVEYLGERISHAEADARYQARGDDDGHTFLFVVDDEVCIDAGRGGNAARFINHSCDGNCETEIEGGRVFIEARRDIAPGEELGYDYQLTWESTDDPAELALYACRCGSPRCRGTMLDATPLDKKNAKKTARRGKSKTRAGARGAKRKKAKRAGRR